MPLPMMGSRQATVVNIGGSSIHGQVNVALEFRFDGEEQVNGGTVACEACPTGLQPGDRVQLDFVLGNLVKVARG